VLTISKLQDVAEVKGGRQNRKERARQTRRRMIDAAYTLFCQRGYGAATMSDIAEEAGVAVQTLYFTFHTKAELLKETLDMAVAGDDDPVPIFERPWMKELEVEIDPRRRLELIAEHGGAILRRVAPLKAAVEAVAAFDPDAAAVWQDNEAQRRRGQGRYVELLAASSDLRDTITAERATDVVVVLMSHRVYQDLTAGCGWSHEEWKTWIVDTLAGQLLA
jgi:TetR/AcrR family transcriptional regulator of autoinduction and epiphytic fitness